ncbi:MAG: hypothetical protein HY906_06800 [Deltaproteobacteria bacterium]|nr:hypothetical protein [Deltaproteobacteria bacterium]
MLLDQVDRERRRAAASRARVVKEALHLGVERRRIEAAVRGHRKAYERLPVTDAEFGPVLRAQRWPK